MDFRSCQLEALKVIQKNFDTNKENYCIKMATGSGKTILTCLAIRECLKRNNGAKILFLAPRTNLVKQTKEQVKSFKTQGKTFNQNFYSIGKFNTKADIQLDTVQAASANYKKVNKDFYDLIIFDEAHIGLQSKEDGDFKKIFHYFDKAIKIGLTATPKNFQNEDEMVNTFGDIDYEYTLTEGIKDGYLSNLGIITTFTEKDNKEINNKNLRSSITETAEVIHSFIDELKHKTIIFCSEDENHAKPLVEELKKILKNKSESIERITGNFKKHLTDFKKGKKINIAVTSKYLAVGIDIPNVKNIIFCKHTNSRSELEQMIGRAVRLINGKQVNWNIYDLGNNEKLIKEILKDNENVNVIYKNFNMTKEKTLINKIKEMIKEGIKLNFNFTENGGTQMTEMMEIFKLLEEEILKSANQKLSETIAEQYEGKNVVYVLSNPSMPDQLKIGFTTNTAEERAKQLFTTGVASPFKVELSHHCENPEALEEELHNYFAKYRISERREFFKGLRVEQVQTYIDNLNMKEYDCILEEKEKELKEANRKIDLYLKRIEEQDKELKEIKELQTKTTNKINLLNSNNTVLQNKNTTLQNQNVVLQKENKRLTEIENTLKNIIK